VSDARIPSGFQIIAHGKTFLRVLDLLETLPRGTLLDVPSGEGALSVAAREMGFQVLAGDIDPKFFKAKGIECRYMDMNRVLPVEDQSLDYVVCLEGVEHLENAFQFTRECNRILKPGGRLVISTPNILNLASRLKYFFSGFYALCPRPINEFSHLPVFDHINPVTFYQVRYMLHSSGFQLRKVTTDLWRRSALGFLAFYPVLRLYSIRTMRKESDPRQREANREIRGQINSLDLLLGRTLILEAEKTRNPRIQMVAASEV
jgi:SAM-dependent methyltransferase